MSKNAFSTRSSEYAGMKMQGFQIKFANGYTVSVAFGDGNYCDKGETTAETAIIAPDGKFTPYKGDDDVQGWQTPADVLATMNYAASLT